MCFSCAFFWTPLIIFSFMRILIAVGSPPFFFLLFIFCVQLMTMRHMRQHRVATYILLGTCPMASNKMNAHTIHYMLYAINIFLWKTVFYFTLLFLYNPYLIGLFDISLYIIFLLLYHNDVINNY